MRNNSYYTMY